MLPGDYNQSADVRELDTYGIVSGISRPIKTVTLDREMANDLPDSVAGGGGIAGGSGTITWATLDDIEDREPSPWHGSGGWPPEPGDRVQVYATDGATSWPRFTGVIDRTRGSVGGTLVSDIVDLRDRLNVPFTREALLRRHVPQYHGGDYRLLGLSFWSLLTVALRRAGLYNTPPAGDYAALSVPLQGTAWAHLGSTTAASNYEGNTYPEFYQAPWGLAVSTLHAEFAPVGSFAMSRTDPLQVSLMVAENHTGNAEVQVYFGTYEDTRVRLRVFPTRQVTAYWHGTDVVTLSENDMRGATIVALVVRGSTWTLRANNGAERTGTYQRVGTTLMSSATIWADGSCRIAGVIVDSPTPDREFRNLSFTPDVVYNTSNLVGEIDMSPRLENRNLRNFVDEICEDTLTAAWFDESGVLQMMPSDRLMSASPVQTVTSLDDVLALDWETSLLHSRSAVHVEWQSASVSRSRERRQELYRGRGSLGPGDTVEIFATPGTDEEWFEVHRDPQRLNDSNWPSANTPTDSIMGVHYVNADGDEIPTSSATTRITVEQLGTVSVKITHESVSYGPNVEGRLEVSEEDNRLRESRKGENLPVIRGRGKGVWIDETYTSRITGPSASPELVHDLGPWGGADAAKNIGDLIASRVSRVEPTIPGLTVTYDPRRQLGDVIDIELGILDVRLRALVVGISESHQTGEYSQQLKIRIISATSSRNVTYEELEAAWTGSDYNALQAVWDNLTYTDFENNPLEGAPND